MITAEQFKELYIDEDGDVNLPGKECVWMSDEIVEHKMTYVDSVYRLGDQLFKITLTRSNSGYWSDSESYPPEVVEVKAVEKTVIVYE